MSAFVYYSFDDKTKNVPSTSSEISMSSYTISWNPVHEPGRKSPVVLCGGFGASCMQIWNGLPCLKFVAFPNRFAIAIGFVGEG